jgi:hypothetical protein
VSDNTTPGVRFQSGVYVGQRDPTTPFEEWFDPTPLSQFTAFTIGDVEAQRLHAAYGLIGKRKPTTLRLDGRGVPAFVDALYAVEADVTRSPTNTQSGFRTAAARRGYLLEIRVRLADNIERAEWGIVTNVDVRVDRGPYVWAVDFVFEPADLLWWDPLDTLFVHELPEPEGS